MILHMIWWKLKNVRKNRFKRENTYLGHRDYNKHMQIKMNYCDYCDRLA